MAKTTIQPCIIPAEVKYIFQKIFSLYASGFDPETIFEIFVFNLVEGQKVV